MVSQISLGGEVCVGPENILDNKNGDSSVPISSQDPEAPQIPVQKQTRQWAAWTRQEEELFFSALRQVGKNFEKITSRVQSKNKDQVRHYYYRLVRRMNKLLGPELCLDAKNSKDTIAAMLRWWSLLEKYSCKASKLHLKPRRFKIFVETLENQLLKDRKKNTRKRLSTGEENSSVAQIPAPTHGRASGHDNRAVKAVLVDSQNAQKVVTGKGSLFKRNINLGASRTNCKADSSSAKTERKRRKTGLVSTSAYKRWEKAAIAGVSLVADAAEHLERVNTDNAIEHVQEPPGKVIHSLPTSSPAAIAAEHLERVDTDKEIEHVQQTSGKAVHSVQTSSQNHLNENNIQNSTKLKLQLFPIDECTQRALEMDNHNPHLELTLSTRKKISSVVDHLNRKWGNTNLLAQEMMLFPFWAQRENLAGYQKWTKDSPLCAADVYCLIGSPPVFRLRYGWFSKAEVECPTAQPLLSTSHNEQSANVNLENGQNTEKQGGLRNDHLVSSEQMTMLASSSASVGTMTRDLAITRPVENTKDITLSAGDWADTLTSISVGDLLSESSPNMDVNSVEFPVAVESNFFQQNLFTCDSFDAAIAAHIYKHQNKVNLQQALPSQGPSIWDAEETCDAFAFQKNSTFCNEFQSAARNDSPEAYDQNTIPNPSVSHQEIEESTKMGKSSNVDTICEDLVDECRFTPPAENITKDFGALTDISWPDSLGPLDLDIPSSRCHNDDLILSDSLGGLSRFIANSMDSFQSGSYFGLDKREAVSTGDPCKTTFSDFKISSEV